MSSIYFSFSIYLSIPTRLFTDTVITIGVAQSKACIFVKGQLFYFEFETANQPGFKPRSPGHKEATLTIELHSIDHLKVLFITSIFIFLNTKNV